MTKGNLYKKLSEGMTIDELVNSNLSLIGNNDDVDSVEDVKANSTTDSFIDDTTQQMGKNRNTGLQGMDLINTVMEEDFDQMNMDIKKTYPLISKNLEVLVDSLTRRDVPSQVYAVILKKIKNLYKLSLNRG